MRIIYKLPLLLFFSSVVFFQAFAQTGIVSGTVIDGEYNEPMAFANVLVKGTTTGTTSDFDGKYQLELEAGTYTLEFSFVGYGTVEISDIIVKANEEVFHDVTLSANSLDEILITTSAKKNTETAVLNLQKKSVTLLDGLSIQTIKKTGASDVAAAVKTIPGVTVQDGKYVFVRGLGDRYSKSILNGVDIPGLDPDRNTIPMDIFPTNLIDNIIVVKSASAEYPADFTGGVVDIVTKDFPTKQETSISLGASYNPDMHFNDNYLNYEGSDTDFWGYDDGTRDLPINRFQPIPTTDENRILLNSLTNRFQKELSAKQEKSDLNYSFGITHGNQFNLGDSDKLGYQMLLSYKNNTTFYENRLDNQYIRNPNDFSITELDDVLVSDGSTGKNEVLLNGMLGVVYKTTNSKYKLSGLHIQNGESQASYFNQVLSQDGTGGADEPLVKHALTYTERSVTNFALSGDHRFDLNGKDNQLNFKWTFSPTFTKVHDKNHRITPLQIDDLGDFEVSPSASSFPLQLWRYLQEENWVTKIDFDTKHNLFNIPSKVKFGGSIVYKFRDFSVDRYDFDIVGNDSYISDGVVDNLLLGENLWSPETGEGTIIDPNSAFVPSNSYEGEHFVFATYLSNEFGFSDKIKLVLGLRMEQFESYYYEMQSTEDRLTTKEQFIDEVEFYPSANFIFSPNDDSNFRASYYRTTARPSFKESSRAEIFDPILNTLFIGNSDLVPTFTNNFDLRYERFRENGQMYAVSAFLKDFKDPIERTFFESAASQITAQNLGDALVYGFEAEFRQNLGFLLESLTDLKFVGNGSYTISELTMGDAEYTLRQNARRTDSSGNIIETVDRKRDLQGQSPYAINVGLDYSNKDKGFQAGLFYNVQGKTLEVVGTGIVPDIYTKPFNSLNLTLNKSFGEAKKSSLSLKVKNILGSEKESVYEAFNAQDQLFSLRQPGTEFSLGYSYKF